MKKKKKTIIADQNLSSQYLPVPFKRSRQTLASKCKIVYGNSPSKTL